MARVEIQVRTVYNKKYQMNHQAPAKRKIHLLDFSCVATKPIPTDISSEDDDHSDIGGFNVLNDSYLDGVARDIENAAITLSSDEEHPPSRPVRLIVSSDDESDEVDISSTIVRKVGGVNPLSQVLREARYLTESINVDSRTATLASQKIHESKDSIELGNISCPDDGEESEEEYIQVIAIKLVPSDSKLPCKLVRVCMDDSFAEIFRQLGDKLGWIIKSASFDGVSISLEKDTPQSLEMEDDDQLDIRLIK